MTNEEVIRFLIEDLQDMYSDDEKYRRPYYEQAIKALEFAEFTGKMLFDDWYTDCNGVFPELACRRLCELGIVELKDGVYSLKKR